MLITEAYDKRELSGYIMTSLQNILGNDVAGVFNIEDFEYKNNPEEARNFILSEMKRLNIHACIFVSWIFTKELYNKFKEYVKYEEEQNNPELYIIFFPNFLSFAVFDSQELLKEFIIKLPQSFKEKSNLNIKNIVESDNAVEVSYFNKVEVLYFDEKPKELSEIFKENE